MRTARPVAEPLDAATLDRLALRYVGRFATTRGRLADYLTRKIRERGCAGDAVDPGAVADRMVALGYVDDRAYAEAKAAAMARKGLGPRRIAGALRHARVGDDDAQALAPAIADRGLAAALAFARRRRIGPYADTFADASTRARQVAAMARAGHGFTLARRIVDAAPGETIEQDDDR